MSGTKLYGTTAGGGSSGRGTVFSVNTYGSGYAVLYSFTESVYGTNADGANPEAGLVLSGTTLYGTTVGGGSSGNGTVFSVNTDGSGYTVLYSFTVSTSNGLYNTNADGANPVAGLVLSGTTLYGTTTGGGNSGNGTVFSVNTNGTGFSILYSFTAFDPTYGTNSDGASPHAGLILSGNTLYGTTAYGGSSGNGTVFAVNTDGTGFKNLYSFTAPGPYTGINSDGANPVAGLILSGNTLYGTAQAGGSSGNGTVFAVSTDGTDFTTLYSFTGSSDGANPQAGLILSGNTLYGTTANGGSFGNGTVFQVNTDGSEFAVLNYFNGSDGGFPIAGLVLSDSTFYGVTVNGGGLNSGALFSLSPGPPTIAAPPESQTAQAGSTVDLQVDAGGYPPPSYQWFFNGTNAIDGATNSILELTNILFPKSGAYTVVIANAYGSVTSLVATLTVQDPSIITQPVSQTIHPMQTAVFSIVADGTPPLSFQWFKDGLSLNVGGNISGVQTSTLTLSNVLVADVGGYSVIVSNAYGSVTSAVAALAVNQAVYSVLHNFGGSDGANPQAGLILSGNTLYGTTANGDTWGNGTVFAVNTDGTGFTNLHFFTETGYNNTNSDGAIPQAGLILLGNTLYGTTTDGGISGNGTVFAVNTDGTDFANLYSFTATVDGFTATGSYTATNSDGANPQAELVLSGNTLYGTTGYGGNYGYGTVFAINTDGTDFTTLHTFSGSEGAIPLARLILSGNTLYGTTAYGGSSGNGTVFAVNTDGTGFTNLHSFTGSSDGADPKAGLILSGNTLYGTTAYGGTNGAGTVFAVNTDGTGFTNLYSFTAEAWVSSINASTNSDGADPYAGLTLSGNTLYGTTTSGGSSGNGTVFAVNTDGSGFTTLYSFTATGLYNWNNSDGANPWAGLTLSGNTLYGATFFGGSSGGGTVFNLSLLSPTIITPPQSQTAETESTINLTVDAISSQPLTYQWLFNGTNLIICSTNGDLELTNVQFSQSGAYTVVVTNLFGTVTSAPVMLNVIVPVARRPVPGVQVTGETGSLLNVDYANSLRAPANWTTFGSVSLTSTSQYCFDMTVPLPSQRFYRVWQAGTPSVVPSLNPPGMVPAITLTGNVSDSLRLDCINQFGPTNAWTTLDTITLTNTSQLYFDVSALGQPPRLYRILPVP